MVSPHAADLVDQRLQGVAVAGDQRNGEIRRRRRHRSACRRPAPRRPAGPWPSWWRRCAPTACVCPRADQAGHRHHQRQRQREAQRQLAQFAGHCVAFLPAAAALQRIHHFRRHVFLIMLGQHFAGDEGAAARPCAPVATTPWPSRNRAGSTPLKSTGTVLLPSVTRNCTSAPAPWLHAAFFHQPAEAEGDAGADHAWRPHRWGCGNTWCSVPGHRRSRRPRIAPAATRAAAKARRRFFLAFIQ